MTVKFNNGVASAFKNLVHGMSLEDLKSQTIDAIKKQYRLDEEEINMRIDWEMEEIQEAAEAFKKFKPYEKFEKFAVNSWGYDQTNYENIEVVGQILGTVIVLGQYTVYGVAKRKFVEKVPYTNLDNVRSTDWEKPYTSDEILDQAMENVYTGH